MRLMGWTMCSSCTYVTSACDCIHRCVWVGDVWVCGVCGLVMCVGVWCVWVGDVCGCVVCVG